jgi:hypothetical protein
MVQEANDTIDPVRLETPGFDKPSALALVLLALTFGAGAAIGRGTLWVDMKPLIKLLGRIDLAALTRNL